MSDLHGLGPAGEAYAADLLRRQGHRILDRNQRCSLGEIDLVTWHRDTLVFVEVRTHEVGPERSPAESVTPAKQRRICRTARWYVARRVKGALPPCRFDVVWLTARDGRIVDGGVMEGAFEMRG